MRRNRLRAGTGGGVDRGDDGKTSIAGRPATSIPPAADEELSSPFPTETSAAAGDRLCHSPSLPAAATTPATPRRQPPSQEQTPSRPWRCAAAPAKEPQPSPSGRLRAPMARQRRLHAGKRPFRGGAGSLSSWLWSSWALRSRHARSSARRSTGNWHAPPSATAKT